MWIIFKNIKQNKTDSNSPLYLRSRVIDALYLKTELAAGKLLSICCQFYFHLAG